MGEKYEKKTTATDSELEELVIRSQSDKLVMQLVSNSQVTDLFHYGVPGMRWGVRKPRGQRVAAARSKKKSSVDSDYGHARELRRKPLKHLSNQDLKELTTRMELEGKYNKLNPSRIKKGESAVKAMISVGTLATTAYAFKNSDLAKDIAKKVAAKKAVKVAAKAAS